MQFCLEIVNEKGLHARASAKFVETVERFDARALVCRDGMEVSGDSIMGLMMLAAGKGTSIEVGSRATRPRPGGGAAGAGGGAVRRVELTAGPARLVRAEARDRCWRWPSRTRARASPTTTATCARRWSRRR